MKNVRTILASALLFIGMTTAFAGGTKVYITEGGKKYHKKNCSVVKTGKTETTLDEAKKKGYTSCNVCYKDAK